MTVFVADVV